MAWAKDKGASAPYHRPMAPARKIPPTRTTNTFTPITAVTSTAIYGKTLIQSNS